MVVWPFRKRQSVCFQNLQKFLVANYIEFDSCIWWYSKSRIQSSRETLSTFLHNHARCQRTHEPAEHATDNERHDSSLIIPSFFNCAIVTVAWNLITLSLSPEFAGKIVGGGILWHALLI